VSYRSCFFYKTEKNKKVAVDHRFEECYKCVLVIKKSKVKTLSGFSGFEDSQIQNPQNPKSKIQNPKSDMSDMETLLAEIRACAERSPFPIDTEIYQSAGKEPTQPILYAGNLKSNLCFFGRDLGRDEVYNGQPLIGAAGKLVRQGFYRAMHHQPAKTPQELQSVCDRLLLTNTVPYKPPGNKAYETEVKERFRPFIERLLVIHWQGNQILTLGTEAFKWFAPYAAKGEVNKFFLKPDRYKAKLPIMLRATEQGMEYQRLVTLMPLPHPSPLNQQYYAQFPQMLQQRLAEVEF
jgi:uracil-DNA glycosylase